MSDSGQFLSVSLSAKYRTGKPVLQDLVLNMRRGEILGLVGGSGSGKSTLALAILGLLDPKRCAVVGSVHLNGRELLALSGRQMRHLRGREISLVLQSPSSALNPMLRIGTQMREAWRAHQRNNDGKAEIEVALHSVCLRSDDEFLKRYPSEISVGQGQRLLIAMAILHSPALLIADEPTSALDPLTQIEILALFQDINRRWGTAILLVSHDLAAVESICHRIAVLHEGKILGCGPLPELRSSAHPYIAALFGTGLSSRDRTLTAAAGAGR